MTRLQKHSRTAAFGRRISDVAYWNGEAFTRRTEDWHDAPASKYRRSYISEVVLNVAAIFERCNTKPLPEDIVHVCLAGETTSQGDINQQHLGLSK